MKKYIILLLIIISACFLLLTSNKTERFNNNNKCIALSYDNSTSSTNTDNLINLFENNGYKYKIVGKNKKWEGWYGRTMEYLNTINELISEDSDYYILLCDGRDVLVNENYEIFIEKAIKLYNKHKSIIFGAERHCCAGNTGINEDIRYKNKMIDIAKNKTQYDYYYLNFGLIFGKATDIKRFFETIDIKPGGTDQSLAVIEFCKNPDKYWIDYDQEIFSNHSGECKLTWDDNAKKYKHSVTNTYPSLIHFPGNNWDCYKDCANNLFKNINSIPVFIDSKYRDE
jgi:hypothetical protein